MAWKHVGDVGSDSGIVVEVDQDTGTIMIRDNGIVVGVDQDTSKIMIRDNTNGFVFNAASAAYLAVLLDEAIALVKGEGTKL